MRVHLYERCFRQKPVRCVLADEIRARVTHDTGGAPGGVTDEARFSRTTVSCIWGASDPLFHGAEPRQEGGRGGRSRPRCLVTVAGSRADCDTGGTKRRPLVPIEPIDCEGHRGLWGPSARG